MKKKETRNELHSDRWLVQKRLYRLAREKNMENRINQLPFRHLLALIGHLVISIFGVEIDLNTKSSSRQSVYDSEERNAFGEICDRREIIWIRFRFWCEWAGVASVDLEYWFVMWMKWRKNSNKRIAIAITIANPKKPVAA